MVALLVPVLILVQRRAAARDMGPAAAPVVGRAPAPELAMDGGVPHVDKPQLLRRLRVGGRMR
ncbi:hypothetical protein OG413_18855 [Streptomyces sp. NBC_01433]|uniref:hypothetical protein n=1 Tax=Streptomyces sp. NBC_01433 TaxID=2903864 RepID=UPI002253CE6A|nr:hypothetical protein [Streptomyces sp. NBC_01433]MCX4677335.1 hypothetical protein [Streptomyces sp. NBC_01433]